MLRINKSVLACAAAAALLVAVKTPELGLVGALAYLGILAAVSTPMFGLLYLYERRQERKRLVQMERLLHDTAALVERLRIPSATSPRLQASTTEFEATLSRAQDSVGAARARLYPPGQQ